MVVSHEKNPRKRDRSNNPYYSMYRTRRNLSLILANVISLSLLLLFVVVLTLTHRHNAMQSVSMSTLTIYINIRQINIYLEGYG